MKEVDFKTYQLLFKDKSISKSDISGGVLQSEIFKNLISAKILAQVRSGRGFRITVVKENEFQKFFKTLFPEHEVPKSKSGNIKKYRNSKAKKVSNIPIFFFRGFTTFKINNQFINIDEYTKKFGVFSASPNSIIADKVCFVENLESFLHAEKVFGTEYLFIHKYGRIGKSSISMIQSKKVVVFVDYDFNGLGEYLRIKEVLTNAELYVPNNYNELFERHSKILNKSKAKMSKLVKNSKDAQVVKIREQVAKGNKFLEQEILIDV